jgi:hypothetical protein
MQYRYSASLPLSLGFNNPRNSPRWKLLQLACVRLWIFLFGLRATNTTLCTPRRSWACDTDDPHHPCVHRAIVLPKPATFGARNVVILPKPARLHCIFFFVILGLKILILICYIATLLWYAALLMFYCIALICYIATLLWYATLSHFFDMLHCFCSTALLWCATLSHCFDMLHCL